MKRQALVLLRSMLVPAVLALGVLGGQSGKAEMTNALPPMASTTASVDSTVATPATQAVIRIKAGAAAPFKDSNGNIWAADAGFSGGDTVERPDVTITNTTEPGIYRSEHYSMDSFSWPLTNGTYQVKLHFCETYEGIGGPGQRVFSFKVQGQEFKDFDVWVKAGGPFKAYVETVPVKITDGKLLITFTTNVENPQINGIEIIPQGN